LSTNFYLDEVTKEDMYFIIFKNKTTLALQKSNVHQILRDKEVASNFESETLTKKVVGTLLAIVKRIARPLTRAHQRKLTTVIKFAVGPKKHRALGCSSVFL